MNFKLFHNFKYKKFFDQTFDIFQLIIVQILQFSWFFYLTRRFFTFNRYSKLWNQKYIKMIIWNQKSQFLNFGQSTTKNLKHK